MHLHFSFCLVTGINMFDLILSVFHEFEINWNGHFIEIVSFLENATVISVTFVVNM